MKRTLLITLCVACSNPTVPIPAPIFPYPGCTMTLAGIVKTPKGTLEDVWHTWTCTDGRTWRVTGDGTVINTSPLQYRKDS